jgi:hypothetical protein
MYRFQVLFAISDRRKNPSKNLPVEKKRRKSKNRPKLVLWNSTVLRISNIGLKVTALDLDAARTYLHAVERMAGEGARSCDVRVVLLALRLVELQAPRARALARAA